MLSDFPWDPWHVHKLLGEDIVVSLEEVDEHAFLFVGEHYPDANALRCVGDIDRDLLCVLGRLEGAIASLGSIWAPWGQPFEARPTLLSWPLSRRAHSWLACKCRWP